MAVIVIMSVIMAVVIPNLGARQTSALHDEAVRIAGQLELARQLAVVTGSPHRMLIDVETGAFRLEWFGGLPDEEVVEEDGDAFAPRQKIDFSPPNDDHLFYRPIDSRFGINSYLDSDFFFQALDTDGGYFDAGEIQLVFQRDGTTDAAQLVIADGYGNTLALEVRPLLDAVRILDDEG